MQKLLGVPQLDNPTWPYLSPNAAKTLRMSPLLALGTLDSKGRPWTTVWAGESGFARPVAESTMGLKTIVDQRFDPVIEALVGKNANGEIMPESISGKIVSGLTLDFDARFRQKLAGRVSSGALTATEEGMAEVSLVVKIDESYGKRALRTANS